MPSLFGSRRRRSSAQSSNAQSAPPSLAQPEAASDDDGRITSDGSMEWVGTDGVVVGGAPDPAPDPAADPGAAQAAAQAAAPAEVRPAGSATTAAGERSDPARAATDGMWEVIRPAAIVPEEAARRVLVELAHRDLENGGEWQSEPQMWSRYDGPVGPDGSAPPELIGTIHVTYGTPTKYEITVYRVTVTAVGVAEGWTVASLTDEALGFGGLTLAQCPRATMSAPPRPYTY